MKEFKKELAELKHFLNGSSDQRRKVTMILKLKEKFDEFSYVRLKQVCLALCFLLKTAACPLDVQEGCVKITVTIPAVVAEDVFPFSPAMSKAFKKAFPTLISVSYGRLVEIFEVS